VPIGGCVKVRHRCVESNPLNAFGKGDYGPSGEDVRSRFVLAGFHVRGGFELTALVQAESARPFTLTTPVDFNGLGDPANNRAVANGVQTSLDQFRGTPYIQIDMRVTRPFKIGETLMIKPLHRVLQSVQSQQPRQQLRRRRVRIPSTSKRSRKRHGFLP
jgi:hypothetical protein